MPLKRTRFNPLWISETLFKYWLDEVKGSIYAFKCNKCQVILDLGNMGRTALRKHIQSKKHLSIEASRTSQPSGLFRAW